ncbi:MAG TPA: site-2 protease family protein [Candidatus Methylomirabilis sp.]|nr:site-2 protease family protein [Candidatus Methylomirabilis sp.]
MDKVEKWKPAPGKYREETVRVGTVHIRSMPSIRTSSTEIIHVIISWLAISYAFAILLLWSKSGIRPSNEELFSGIFNPLVISLFTVGISFIVHEMSHKIVAQRFGSWAEFRMNPIMLLLMLILVYQFGILFAAPGAVIIYGGNVGRRENGRISLAGPLSNLILGMAFFLLLSEQGILYEIGKYGVIINIVLALFNMIPFGVFDGRKIWDWNKLVYIGFVASALLLLYLFVVNMQLVAPAERMPF